MEDERVLE